MTSYMNAADRLYRAGARNFLFLNVPAYQYSPNVGGNQKTVAAYIKVFNDALVNNTNNFSDTHAGVSPIHGPILNDSDLKSVLGESV